MKKIEFGSVKSLRSFDDFRRLIRDNKEMMKTAALPLVIGAAVLFFWFYGSSDSEVLVADSMEESADPGQGIIYSSDGGDDAVINLTGMYVDISGEVFEPGVYEVSEGTRLFQVIEMAGGLTDSADVNSLNRAEIVYDGQKIIVPAGGSSPGADENDLTGDSARNGFTNGKVNLNLADSATLQTIPGIGPSKAERILDYRKKNGRFKTTEDIMNITGIGQKTFESIKEYITV